MNLISVTSIKKTTNPGTLNMAVVANLGSGPVSIPFTYIPGDPYGLAPAVKLWLAANPNFPMAPADPAPGTLDKKLTKRQVVRALILGANVEDPDSAVEDALGAITNPQDQALARADWRYAPYFDRYHPLFQNDEVLAAMGLNSGAVDLLWALGAEQPQ